MRKETQVAQANAGRIGSKKPDTVVMHERLAVLAHMFAQYRDDKIMRELCRLAIVCAQERLTSA